MSTSADLVMPKLGLTMTEGRVAEWVVKPGAPFAQGEIVQVIAAAMSNRTPAAHPDHNLDTDRP